MRKRKTKGVNVGARLKRNGMGWAVVACLFAGDTMLFVESEEEFYSMVDEFYCVSMRRKLKMNAEKNKMISFDKKK